VQRVPLQESRDTRLEAFIDGAFAFAVTLLIVSVGSVPENFTELMQSLKAIPAFAMSFALLCMFWNAHVRWSRNFGTNDGISTLLSLMLVFLVLIYVFPLRLMSVATMDYFFGGRLNSGLGIASRLDARWFFALYGVGFMAMSGIILSLFFHSRRKLILGNVRLGNLSDEIIIWAILVGVGLLATLVAVFAKNPFYSAFSYGAIPLAIGLYYGAGALRKKRQKMEEATDND
jgi:uncharacterized membrane protein